jgi:putative transposase
MPWKTTSVTEQRWRLVHLALRAKRGLAELCRRCGISRKTAYKWMARFKARGRSGLGDQSRAAHGVSNRPTSVWLSRIRRVKRQHPRWGAAKIRWVLERRFGRPGRPSEAAVGRWLQRWGLTRKRRRHGLKGPSLIRAELTQAQAPNEVWTVDFKGWFKTGDGCKVEPLTVRDLATRYVLAIGLMAQQNVERTRREFARLFGRYGLPKVIRMDNGSPFGSRGALGLTRLSAWWVKLGIRVEFIEPGHPEQNGGHEQFHRVYKEETLQPAAATPRAQQRRSNRWGWGYNHERPHEALGMEVPAALYRKSRRRMPKRLKPWTYPPAWSSRRVKGKGMIHFDGRARYVGEAFEQERVGLKRVRAGVWEVYFGPWLIGELWDADAGGIRAVTYRKRQVKVNR